MAQSKQITFRNSTPKCFESKLQYQEWLTAARMSGIPRCGPCSDCLPDFQAKMIAQDRCENPQVQFKISKNDGIEGYIPSN